MLELLTGALRLDPTAFASLTTHPNALRIALWVVFLAGLSSAAGQSVVLFAARVSPRRFVASLLLSAGLFVGVFLFWTASIWLIARYGYGADEPFATGLRTVGLAYAPQLFGFFVLVPYFGSGIGVGLSIWNLLAIVIATEVAFGIDLMPALVSSAAGWVLLQLAQRTIGWPLTRLARWVRTRVAGARLDDIDDLLRRNNR
jgi:hypothetical protein